jgi:3-hydroxyacyl-CoA dehydrogenase
VRRRGGRRHPVTEEWLIDAGAQALLRLLEHPKTQERIMGMLQTGKPVRVKPLSP